jgi:hypothetical protein
MPTDSTLAKQKVILALLAADPAQSRRHSQFRDCLHHIPHYVSVLFSRTKAPETYQIRCGLKHKCPKCMDFSHVEAARRPDFRFLLRAAKALGGGDRGEDCKVWLLSGEFNRKVTAKHISTLLGRNDRKYRAALSGRWGGEFSSFRLQCPGTPFRAIIDSNGRKRRTAFVFNGLVFGAPESELDEQRLADMGLEVSKFHGKLGLGWTTYLRRWTTARITDADATEIVQWMTGRGRTFESIGALRGVRAREQASHLEQLHRTSGKSARIGFFHRMEQAPEVIDRINHSLPLNASNLLNHTLSESDRNRIMSLVRPQVNSVLTPPMDPAEMPASMPMPADELRARLDELRALLVGEAAAAVPRPKGKLLAWPKPRREETVRLDQRGEVKT